MPLISLPFSDIVLPVSDRVAGSTIVKQKAHSPRLSVDEQSRAVHLLLTVSLFAATEQGNYGPALSGPGFSDYQVTLVADNNTAVNPQKEGAICYIRISPELALNFLTKEPVPMPVVENGDSWRSFLDSLPEPLALQGDFFCFLRDTQPVLMRKLIEDHIQQADLMGRFA
ncbi:hypothetical protein [Hymenobacter sp. YC55]|uniref:hypothetical protein n=1 Tax=Hymenobacter sp. YC55 TaxID=3034019 RepID=UPI0023F6BFE5|nr:hypothetical protein [Hymenobacter sp. YC55]MDF7813597.1 hypothetical protein [Hymenobacter sp. YC55]